jgi:hypothetical protein
MRRGGCERWKMRTGAEARVADLSLDEEALTTVIRKNG